MAIFTDSLLLDITTIILLLLTSLYIYFKYTFLYWSRKGVFHEPPSVPFGNTKDFILQRTTFGQNINVLYQKYKQQGRRYMGYYVFNKANLLLLDPELVKTIMTKDFHHFPDRSVRANDKEPLSHHLLALTGVKWKNLRQKLTPTFTSGKMKMMFQTFVACSFELEHILDEYATKNDAIDIKDVLGRFTTDIIGSCAFGLDCNSLKNPDTEFRKYGKMVFEPSPFRVFKGLIRLAFPKLYDFFGLTQADERINSFFQTVVKDTVEYRENNQVKRNDFMQLLINIKNTGDVEGEKIVTEPGKSLTMNEIAAQSFLFFLAGFETSSTTMTFFLYDMATNQDIQDRVRQEIQDMLKRHDGKLTYEGVLELQYLDWAINESMRLHSAIAVIQRTCTVAYRIPDTDVMIDKGTLVTIPVLGMQSDPEYYPEPERFDPERFSPEQREKRHPFTFLPFGEGPRHCIGFRFGLLQTKVGLISLLKNHRFTLSPKTKVPLKMDPKAFIFSVVGGVWLQAKRI